MKSMFDELADHVREHWTEGGLPSQAWVRDATGGVQGLVLDCPGWQIGRILRRFAANAIEIGLVCHTWFAKLSSEEEYTLHGPHLQHWPSEFVEERVFLSVEDAFGNSRQAHFVIRDGEIGELEDLPAGSGHLMGFFEGRVAS